MKWRHYTLVVMTVLLMSLAFMIGTEVEPEDAVFTIGDFAFAVFFFGGTYALGVSAGINYQKDVHEWERRNYGSNRQV